MNEDGVPSRISQVSKCSKPSDGDEEDEQCTTGGTDALRLPRSMSRKAVEEVQSASDSKAKKPRMAGDECNQREPELDEKKHKANTNELGLKKNEFVSLPTVIISRICLFHTPLDIINFAMCHSKFGDTCFYELRMRKLRLKNIRLLATEATSRTLDCEFFESMGASFREECIYVWCRAGSFITFHEPFRGDQRAPGVVMKIPHADLSIVTKNMCQVFYYLVQCCDVSELVLHINSLVSKNLPESERLDMRLAECFGEHEYPKDEKIAIMELTVSPGTVSCLLGWFAPRQVNCDTLDCNYTGSNHTSHDGDKLAALVDGVERLYVAKYSDVPVTVDNIMENCRVPYMFLGNINWSESSFRSVLTAHALGSGPRRTIEYVFIFRRANLNLRKMFSDWQKYVGPDVAVRNGEPRVTMEAFLDYLPRFILKLH